MSDQICLGYICYPCNLTTYKWQPMHGERNEVVCKQCGGTVWNIWVNEDIRKRGHPEAT